MFFYGKIVIPFHSLSSKSKNSKMFTHSDFNFALSFAIIDSIATTTFKQKIGILSWNVKKLINLHLLWNTIRKLQWGSLFFIARLILVWIWSESLPKYGSTIINSFLDTVLTTRFCVNTLSKNFFWTFVNEVTFFYTRYLSIYLFHDGISQNPNTCVSFSISITWKFPTSLSWNFLSILSRFFFSNSNVPFRLLTSFIHSGIFAWIFLFHQDSFHFSLLLFSFFFSGFSATTYTPTYNKSFILVIEITLQSFVWFWRFFHTSQQQQWLQIYFNGVS